MKTFKVLSFLSFAILSVSCSVSKIQDFVVGDNFINDNTGTMMIDTLTMNSSTVKFDSIVTNSSGRLLVGCNYNDFSGYKNSNAFMDMTFSDNITATTFVYDSLCLVLTYDTYFSGDTTVTQTFDIHRINEQLALDDNSHLYSTSKFSYDEAILGSIQLKPRPNTKKNLSIKLSDQMGNRLAQMIKDKKDTLTNYTLFRTFFKGLVIISEKDVKGAAVGFRVTTPTTTSGTGTTTTPKPTAYIAAMPEMRLYYHLSPNPDNLSNLYYKFVFNTNGIYFNQISGNSVNTPIENISVSNDELSSTLSNNQVIVQSGIQTFSKIKIPYVDNLLIFGKNSGIVAATLRLFPIKGTYTHSSDLPDSLYIYSSDRKNILTSQLTLPGSTNYSYAILNVVKDVEETVYYQADISSFVSTELQQELETSPSLMIGFGSSATTKSIGQVILGGVNSGKYSPVLNIYYYHN